MVAAADAGRSRLDAEPCPRSAMRPVVFVHGYSDSARGFATWRRLLTDAAHGPAFDVRVAEYRSLSNEIGIKDIAEAFDRALRLQAGLGAEEDFDAVVHSTGMLVVRAWLTTYPRRRDRLKHLIALAPATWGSPLAHKGRSWLGAVLKGSKSPFRPDFLEAGDEVLHGLELGSRFTWDLAHRDLFGDQEFYGPDASTPFVFTFVGTNDYGGLRRLVDAPGTDGTVRIAGTSLNSRKLTIDLTRPLDDPAWARIGPWKGATDVPVVRIDGLDHGTIMARPTPQLVQLVREALTVEREDQLMAWWMAAQRLDASSTMRTQWQQFVVRLVDERGDPITDYNLRLFDGREELVAFAADVHTNGRDRSLRNFHVDVTRLVERPIRQFRMQLVASSGTELVGYVGYGSGATPRPTVEVELDLAPLAAREVRFFYPFTTTMVEIRLNREPMPLDGESRLCRFA